MRAPWMALFWILTAGLAAVACAPGDQPAGEGAMDTQPAAGTEAADAVPTAAQEAPTAAREAPATEAAGAAEVGAAADVEDGTYLVDGRSITLVDGLSEIETAPGSASRLVTRYFGNAVDLDLDGDGRMDRAFLLQQEGGGSGTFFYVVAAMGTAEGYTGTDAVLLGDRIAPQSTELAADDPAAFVVNYADRNPGEAMSARPSVGVSKRFKLRDGALVEEPAAP